MNRMRATTTVVLLLLSIAGLSAQRGGRGGGGGRGADDDHAIWLTGYDSADYGLKFPAPPDFSIFTPETPGRFRSIFAGGRIIYMVDLMGVNAAVTVKFLPKATDADVTGFKNAVDSNPPQAKLPEYKKVSVGMIKIGSAHDKDAVEYVYTAKDKDVVTTTRQVVFIHKGNGFIFTCTAASKDYGAVDKKSFQSLFATIEFK